MKINYLLYILLFVTPTVFAQMTSADYLELGEAFSYDNDSSADSAIFYYTKAIELDNNCSECYVRRAWRKHYKDPEGEVSDYKKALEFDPTCFKCYNGIANYYNYVTEDYKTARQYCYKALKVLDCKSKQDYVEQSSIISTIGITYFLELGENNIGIKKDRQVRLAIWDSLINTNPLPRYYQERGNLRSDDFNGDYRGALEDYMVVYDMYKQNNSKSDLIWSYSHLLWSIASSNQELGNYFEAIQYYNKVIELKQKEKNSRLTEDLCKLFYCRANNKMKLDDYRGAIKDYQLAISAHSKTRPFPRLLTLYNSLARARILLDDYQNALTDLNKGIELSNDGVETYSGGEDVTDEDIAFTYYLIGFAKINLKNKDGACKAWSKSGELGNAEAYDAIKKNCK
jgi:tetratricopeptide (TPR) repeat protein